MTQELQDATEMFRRSMTRLRCFARRSDKSDRKRFLRRITSYEELFESLLVDMTPSVGKGEKS